jgi:2-oxoglutarate dehydrogenase E2 component (dihydrolipoamide succinyltransferase)
MERKDAGKAAPAAAPSAKPAPAAPTAKPAAPVAPDKEGRTEQRVPMTRLRARIAERLLQAKNTTAMLTTFNEVNMKPTMDLRARHKDQFEKTHGVRLGFMSFFVKAAVEALKECPGVNASIEGTHIVYRKYFDVGIAVGGGRGLVVPILRNAENLSFADIERKIGDFAKRAQANKIDLSELQGGTFTISNGGIYGSMLSTPIVNPPQSGILGLHAIQERAMVNDGQIVARPMMYVALTYDHRVVDGREAVTFLKRIKDVIENPERIFLEI